MRQHQDESIYEYSPLHQSAAVESRLARGTGPIGRVDEDASSVLVDGLEQIVHDLRGPLQTIALETSLLDYQISDADTENRAAVARISRNVQFLARMVQDLADTCSIEVGQFQLQRTPIDLGSLIEQAIDRIVSTRDRFRVSLEAPTPVVISIDALRIERVFANLLQNALKYAPQDSRIAIRIDVDAERVRISVRDDGPGLTAEETTGVFDKYRRGHSAAGHGSGLGLYISKQIVEAHGGSIGATSVEGCGSLFFFDLPAP